MVVTLPDSREEWWCARGALCPGSPGARLVLHVVVAQGAHVLENAPVVGELGALQAGTRAQLRLDILHGVRRVALEALAPGAALDEQLHRSLVCLARETSVFLVVHQNSN